MPENRDKIVHAFEPEARWIDERTAFFRCSCGFSAFGPTLAYFDEVIAEVMKMQIPSLDYTCGRCGTGWTLPIGLRTQETHEKGENDA
jgi:hypothetical protein